MQQKEHEMQCALIQLCRLHEKKYPGLKTIYAIPNGGHRHIRTAARMKAEGVRAGMPDICLPVPRGRHGALYVELKINSRSRLTKVQLAVHEKLSQENYLVVCYSVEEAWRAIRDYLKIN